MLPPFYGEPPFFTRNSWSPPSMIFQKKQTWNFQNLSFNCNISLTRQTLLCLLLLRIWFRHIGQAPKHLAESSKSIPGRLYSPKISGSFPESWSKRNHIWYIGHSSVMVPSMFTHQGGINWKNQWEKKAKPILQCAPHNFHCWC